MSCRCLFASHYFSAASGSHGLPASCQVSANQSSSSSLPLAGSCVACLPVGRSFSAPMCTLCLQPASLKGQPGTTCSAMPAGRAALPRRNENRWPQWLHAVQGCGPNDGRLPVRPSDAKGVLQCPACTQSALALPTQQCEQSEPAAAKLFVRALCELAAKPVVPCRSLMVSEIPSLISSYLHRRKPTRRAPAAISISATTPLWTSTCQTRTSECCCVGCIMQRHPGTMAQARCLHRAPCCRAVKLGKVSWIAIHCLTLPCSTHFALNPAASLA